VSASAVNSDGGEAVSAIALKRTCRFDNAKQRRSGDSNKQRHKERGSHFAHCKNKNKKQKTKKQCEKKGANIIYWCS
jgi:hypothetical protein